MVRLPWDVVVALSRREALEPASVSMRADAALTLADLSAHRLRGRAAVVIDVFRASTTIVTALANGARMLIPVLTPEEARARARAFPPADVLLGGERRGEPIVGFDLGNSPLQYTPERVRDKVVVFTTTNGTQALRAASGAAVAAVCGLVNVEAVAGWALATGRDLTVVCSGETGALSLEDTVAAGLLLDAIADKAGPLEITDAARACRAVAGHYRRRLDGLLTDSAWARELEQRGYHDDLRACLALSVYAEVPVLEGDVVTRPAPGPSR
ncbi:MAG: 2-phosphosulfolactate phosphatase [Candidatus Rokubacteria bacterium]|nr:2-phosphosulfolactate phosphatase [Candidatus Rokubacteria bacterium]